ncbi:MAG: hypothetical protein JO116_10550, partial [Planctomycetaceae bacterium]|nr:hypothetical protein [Planctomycetaceae bacterium]
CLSYDDALLREDPETLPQVLFVLQGDEQEQDGVHVPLTLTEGAMRRRLAARVPGVLSGRPGSR